MSFYRKKSYPKEISSILAAVLGKKKFKKRIEDCQIFEYWDICVGEKISQHTEPEAFAKGVLKVIVSDHGWLQQLQFLKEEIKIRLNDKLNKKSVENIYFKIGTLKPKEKEEPHIKEELRKIHLSEKDRQKIKEATSHISNAEIRKSIKGAMEKEAKRKKLVEKAGSGKK